MTTQAPQASHASPPHDRFPLDPLSDTYEVLGELAARDDARTFMARRRDDGADVIIVVSATPAGDEGNALSHLAADAKLLSALRHRSLLPVLDGRWVRTEGKQGAGAHDAFALVLERTGAPTLAELLARRDEEFGYARIAHILSEANGVLEWARERKVVHRVILAETLYVEPGTDRVQVAFVARPLPATGVPGAESDGVTIASLARAMLTRSPAAPERETQPLGELRPGLPAALIEETERLLRRDAASPETASAADVSGYIARIAMADALRQAEEHLRASHNAIEIREQEHRAQLEAERRNHDAQIAAERHAHETQLAAERQQHERAIEGARQEHERQVAEQAKQFARERETFAQELSKERQALARQREQHEHEFVDRQRQFERQMAERQKQLERQIMLREKELEREREESRREMAREREALAKEREALARERDALVRDRETQARERSAGLPLAAPASGEIRNAPVARRDRSAGPLVAWIAATWARRPRLSARKLPRWRRDWNVPVAAIGLALLIGATAVAVGGRRARPTAALASSPQRILDSAAGTVYRSVVPLPRVAADTALLAATARDWTPPPIQRPVPRLQQRVPVQTRPPGSLQAQPSGGAADTQAAPVFEIQPERLGGRGTAGGANVRRDSVPAPDSLKAPRAPTVAPLPFAIPAPVRRDSVPKGDTAAKKDSLLRRPTSDNLP